MLALKTRPHKTTAHNKGRGSRIRGGTRYYGWSTVLNGSHGIILPVNEMLALKTRDRKKTTAHNKVVALKKVKNKTRGGSQYYGWSLVLNRSSILDDPEYCQWVRWWKCWFLLLMSGSLRQHDQTPDNVTKSWWPTTLPLLLDLHHHMLWIIQGMYVIRVLWIIQSTYNTLHTLSQMYASVEHSNFWRCWVIYGTDEIIFSSFINLFLDFPFFLACRSRGMHAGIVPRNP